MNAPLADVSSGIFDVLGLPLELRQSIYRLHLSNEGEVDYLGAEDNTEEITHDKPAIKPLLGANVLRVCKQIYDEAILSAYDNRKWALGYAPITPDRLTVNCAQRLARILPATAEKIQRLSLNIEITLETPYKLVRSTAMGDPAKLKSLRTLELFLVLGDIGVRATRWVYQRDSTWRNAPFLVGLICEILAQVPSHIGVVWLFTVADIDGCNCMAGNSRPFRSQGESLNDGLIPRIEDMNLAKDTDDSDETSIEQQHNDATNAPDDEECPTGHDTLDWEDWEDWEDCEDCEDCGGPEQTWETRRNDFHCKG
ncbi:hypothetical protein KCU75_g16840, partial [Aureobasidium melanogenum]